MQFLRNHFVTKTSEFRRSSKHSSIKSRLSYDREDMSWVGEQPQEGRQCYRDNHVILPSSNCRMCSIMDKSRDCQMGKLKHKSPRGVACDSCKTSEPLDYRGHVYFTREQAFWRMNSVVKTNRLSKERIEQLCKEDDERHEREAQRAQAQIDENKRIKRNLALAAESQSNAKRQDTSDTLATESEYVPDSIHTRQQTAAKMPRKKPKVTKIFASKPVKKAPECILEETHSEYGMNPPGLSTEQWAAAVRELEKEKLGPDVSRTAATKEVIRRALYSVNFPILQGGTAPTVRVSTPPQTTRKTWSEEFNENESRTVWPSGECPWFVAGIDDNAKVIEHITTMIWDRIPRIMPIIRKLRNNTPYANTWETAYMFLQACIDNMIMCEICTQVTYPENKQPVTQDTLITAIFKKIRDRLDFGLGKYKHGIQIDTNTTKFGTIINSWLEMSEQELLDGMNYVSAHLCRLQKAVRRNPKQHEELSHLETRQLS